MHDSHPRSILVNLMHQALKPENIPRVKKNNMAKLTINNLLAQYNNYIPVLMPSKTTKRK